MAESPPGSDWALVVFFSVISRLNLSISLKIKTYNGAKVWIFLESAKCSLGLLCVDIQQDKTRKDKVRQGFFLPTNIGKTR